MAAPNLPPGFDFTDPDIYAHRLPVQELDGFAKSMTESQCQEETNKE